MRPIPFAPGYFVTEEGRVFSEFRYAFREMRGWVDRYGYRRLRLAGPSGQVPVCVHRLVALVCLGTPDSPSLIVRHINGDPGDNRLQNLAWGTSAENSADMVRHGRSSVGVKNGAARLRASDIVAIRAEYKAGARGFKRISVDYGVSKKTIADIVHRATWKGVP